MVVVPFKSRGSELRRILKLFKEQFDNFEQLSAYEFPVMRAVYLSRNPVDLAWRGEALHQLALMHEGKSDLVAAKSYYLRSLESFSDHEALGLIRAMRDYALFLARHENAQSGLEQIARAWALHDDDLRNRKGVRQRRITESYLWRIQLLAGEDVTDARRKLTQFALEGSRDCSLRDQHQAIAFAMAYAKGKKRQQLRARQLEINAMRHKKLDALISLTRLAIDTQLLVAGRLIRILIRKE